MDLFSNLKILKNIKAKKNGVLVGTFCISGKFTGLIISYDSKKRRVACQHQ